MTSNPISKCVTAGTDSDRSLEAHNFLPLNGEGKAIYCTKCAQIVWVKVNPDTHPTRPA